MICLLYVTFIYGRCLHSLAVVTPAKYECDSTDLANNCKRVNAPNWEVKEQNSGKPHGWCAALVHQQHIVDSKTNTDDFYACKSSTFQLTWWRHQMETFSALLALCAGNSLVTGEFPTERPVTRSFGVLFELRLNKRLSKQSLGWWFEMPSCSSCRHCNDPSIPL